MEHKLGKQLFVFLAFLVVVWGLLLALQVRMATRLYSNQKDLFAVKLNKVFDDAFDTIGVVDYNAIDSMVAASLHNHGIPYPYDFGVYSENERQFRLLTPDADSQALLEKGFRYNLLRVQEEEAHLDTIIIHFPVLVRRFRLEMIWAYLVIFLLFVLLLCCFVKFFYIILRTRKVIAFREKMAHFVTHELKTPLTTISPSTQLLRDESVVTDEEAKNTYLDVISEETNTLESLVNEILFVFRQENLPISETKDVEMHQLLKEVYRVHSLRVAECGGEVAFDLKAERNVVLGNYTHLFNAFSNLVDNAIKYHKKQLKITISTRNEGDNLLVRVADNGIGISAENMAFIFEPFSRFNTDDAYYVKGFGLGLNYVKHVVEYHKGSVKVESKLGEGTAFTVVLPVKNT